MHNEESALHIKRTIIIRGIYLRWGSSREYSYLHGCECSGASGRYAGFAVPSAFVKEVRKEWLRAPSEEAGVLDH